MRKVLTTGLSERVERLDGWDLKTVTQDPEEQQALERLEPVSWLVVPLAARGRVLGALSAFTTLADRILTPHEYELAERVATRCALSVDNTRLVQQAQHAVRVRDDFLAIVSHDLRGPLSTIVTSAAVQQKAAGQTDMVVRTAEIMQRAAKQMARLISDLLDVANLEAGRLTVTRASCAPQDLVNEAVEGLRGPAVERGIQVITNVPARLPPVQCDHDRVLQIMGNLLGNSIKVMEGGGTLTVRACRVDGHVEFHVEDTGPGIPVEELPNIFDRYKRGKKAGYSGSGLGLAIVKGLVEAHGGRIRVRSVLGQGTTFIFTLPVHPVSTG